MVVKKNITVFNDNLKNQKIYEKIYKTLPIHQYLSKKQVNFIAQKINNFYNK